MVLAMLATGLLTGGALAANGRIVYFGSTGTGGSGGGYDADGGLVFGTLTNTRVTLGGKSATVLVIRNDDNQTLNHVKVAGGTAADGKPYNPAFDIPDGTSLGSLTLSAVIPQTSGVTCDPNSATSFECSVGTLAAGASASFLIVLNPPNTPIVPPATSASYPYWFTGSWNEGWSSTGTNADYNFATGTVVVEANSCAGGTASWFLGNEQVNLGDGGTTCFNQNAEIKSGRNGNVALGGNGGFAAVAVDSSFAVDCPEGYKCFGNTISVSILAGATVPGGVEWSGTWFGTKTIKGVIHFGDNYVNDPDDYTVITFTRQNKCSADKLTDCWVSVTPSSGNVKPAFVTAIWVTDSNGRGGGFT